MNYELYIITVNNNIRNLFKRGPFKKHKYLKDCYMQSQQTTITYIKRQFP